MIERFWKRYTRRNPFSLWFFITPLMWISSLLYGLSLRIIKEDTPIKVTLPVISVGNITVGGTGKTPLVATLARFLQADNLRVGIVSSGYGRESEESFLEPGYKMSKLPAATAGDEVVFLANELPEALFSVDKSKATAAKKLADSGLVDLIIVDDGFQHRALHRDLDIVTFDAALEPRQFNLLPYGMLREPIEGMSRADLIVITRSEFAPDLTALKEFLKHLNKKAELYHAHFSGDEIVGREQRIPSKYLEDKSVFLFAGVGNFQALKRQVYAISSDLEFAMELSDHQRYDQRLLRKIKTLADHFDTDLILTTAKDWVKIGSFDFGREFYYLAQSVDLDPGEERLIKWIKSELGLRD